MTEETQIVERVEVSDISKYEEPRLSKVLAGAEIESQIATAKRYPRSIDDFIDVCKSRATRDEQTAISCYYALPRAGKTIEGPSIRLAEIALSCYKNIVAQGDVSHEDGRFVYAVGMCRDLENNTAIRRIVRRRITDRNGQRYNDDMIAVTANAAVSIAIRDAILAIIPKAYINPIWRECKSIAAGDSKTLASRWKEALKFLQQEMGVDQKRVLAALERKSVEDITVDDLLTLRGFINAIRDGEADVDTVFPEPEKRPKAVAAKEIKGGDSKAKLKEAEARARATRKKPAKKTNLFK